MTDVVTIVVATRNSGVTLERLLRSARNQTYPHVELIVVDNGSSDDTVAIAERFADRVIDHGPERSAQRNQGVALATGVYVLIADSDMELTAVTVAACVETAKTTKAAAIVVPERTIGGGFLASCRALERSCYENDATIEAARFFLREVFVRYGGYDPELTGPEDWDLPARMVRSGEISARANNALILHDESELRLADHLRKKYYYGKSFRRYIQRHPDLARAQLSPLRPALAQNWRRLFANPLLGTSVVALKVAEFGAGALGLVSACVTRS